VTLSCDQARQLVLCYQENALRIMSKIDTALIQRALDRAEGQTNSLDEIRANQPDVYALILLLCASSLTLLPATYSISLGILSKSDQLGPLLASLIASAFAALEESSVFSHPTLTGVEAMSVFQLNLSPL
jgi:hypothetical protein